jgi:hypothetical protein
MTEPSTEAVPDVMPELEITFNDRKMWVRMPRPEQILVWRRTLRQLQEAEVQGWNAEQVMIALERTRKIIDSVLVNKTDVTWLDDEMLEGTIDLMGTARIINLTVEAFADAAAEEGNRETRRAAKKTPAKKATRKKETRR